MISLIYIDMLCMMLLHSCLLLADRASLPLPSNRHTVQYSLPVVRGPGVDLGGCLSTYYWVETGFNDFRMLLSPFVFISITLFNYCFKGISPTIVSNTCDDCIMTTQWTKWI